MDRRELDFRMAGALDNPLRRRLFDLVSSRAPGEVSRDEAASSVGVRRGLAGFHLDRLVEVGLLEAAFRRTSGRTGPGAGRPAKLYRRSRNRITVTVPERRYQLLAGWLVSAVGAGSAGAPARRVRAAAEATGRILGRSIRDAADTDTSGPAHELVVDALRSNGFEPDCTPDGGLILRNCPFAELAAANPDVVCGVNLALHRGLLAGVSSGELEAELDPGPDRCCVVLRRLESA